MKTEQIMKCVNCGQKLTFPEKAYSNLDNYNVGGQVIIASECCNTGYVMKMEVKYTVTEYCGARTEDDWGTKLRKQELISFKDQEPEDGARVALVWGSGSGIECIYDSGSYNSVTLPPTHWYYVD